MELQNQKKKKDMVVGTVIGLITSMMKMPRKTGGDISLRIRIIYQGTVWFQLLLVFLTINWMELDLI
jgi:hypothetical protein